LIIPRVDADDQGPQAPDGPSTEVVDFIRHCYRRRQVSWPEIYDDMCAVAGRGEFRGWRLADLAERGIGFTIPELPRLAALVERVVEDERSADSEPLRHERRAEAPVVTLQATRARAG
jgi:hypothetical protein